MSETWHELLMTDHQTIEKVFEAVQRALSTGVPSAPLLADAARFFREYVDGCHNRKEEDYLFPLIEQRGVPRQGGPLAVMLAEHEQSRTMLPALSALVDRYVAGDRTVLPELRTAFEQYASLLKNHFWKENDILYPMARRVMSDEDGRTVVAGIETTEAAVGPYTRQTYYALADRLTTAGGVEDLSFGLDRHVLAAILNTLPVELSFVDRDDTVRYFSHENSEKIFPRTRGVIGMAVQNCHPQKSVHLVNRILEDFKAGRRSVAEFWIEMGGRSIHIRYFPVHSPQGEYLGTLEVVQDIGAIKRLTGERRLLAEA